MIYEEDLERIYQRSRKRKHSITEDGSKMAKYIFALFLAGCLIEMAMNHFKF